MASGDTKTEQMLNVLANGGDASQFGGCCNTKTQNYILGAIDRVQSVEDEVEELKNNPDVVDIVDTYADLQAYDTQHLTENDIIRVLQDETHSGNSTYYRFTKNPDTWTFIGEISGGGGGDTVYSTKTTSDGPTGGAVYIGNLDATQTEQVDPTVTDAHEKYFWALPSNNSRIPPAYSINIFGNVDGTSNGVSNNNTIMLGSGATTYAHSGIAIGNGTKADGQSVAIGSYAGGGDWSGKVGMVAIGNYAVANNSNYVIHIGGNSGNSYGVRGGSSDNSIAIGKNSMISNLTNSVALGAYAQATRQGEVNVGLVTGETTGGYNNTAYRVIGGVHDPIDAHDAATKGYVDSHAGGNAGAVLYTDMNNIPAPGSQVSNVAMYKDATLSIPYTVSQAITDLSNSGNKLTLFLSDGSGDDLQAYHFTYVHLSGSPNAGTASFDANVFNTMQNSILYIDGDQSSNEFSLQNTEFSL